MVGSWLAAPGEFEQRSVAAVLKLDPGSARDALATAGNPLAVRYLPSLTARGASVDQRDSGAIGRAETKAAKEAQRQQEAAVVWAQVEKERQAVEERTERLRSARLARDAQKSG